MKKIKKSLKKSEQNELLKYKNENRKKEEFTLSLSMQKVAKIVSLFFTEQGWTDASATYGMAWRLVEGDNDELNFLISMIKNPEEKEEDPNPAADYGIRIEFPAGDTPAGETPAETGDP